MGSEFTNPKILISMRIVSWEYFWLIKFWQKLSRQEVKHYILGLQNFFFYLEYRRIATAEEGFIIGSISYTILFNSLLSVLTWNVHKITGIHQPGFWCNYQLLIRYWIKVEYNGAGHQLFSVFKKSYDSGINYCTTISMNMVYPRN
jgi:hypothetical protein